MSVLLNIYEISVLGNLYIYKKSDNFYFKFGITTFNQHVNTGSN